MASNDLGLFSHARLRGHGNDSCGSILGEKTELRQTEGGCGLNEFIVGSFQKIRENLRGSDVPKVMSEELN